MNKTEKILSQLGPPPILPSLSEHLEAYLLKPENLPIHKEGADAAFAFWDRTPHPERCFDVRLAPISTTLKVDRDFATGEVLGFKETELTHAGTTAKNSTSLQRAPGPPDESTRGSSTNYPFWPGGFDEDDDDDDDVEAKVRLTEDQNSILKDLEDESKYLTVPIGFSRGLQLGGSGANASTAASKVDEEAIVNLASVLTLEDDEDGIWADSAPATDTEVKASDETKRAEVDDDGFNPEDTGVPVLSISDTTDSRANTGPTKTEWAEIVDITVPMTDFSRKVPQMAYTWPFELDTFQKQAVYRLERNESVFVAAHTSAGKTVVAEYAIALSQKHMTRTIYTSPIKALSNQKFRDFKDTFEDVGLVTGDIQINPTATCLIMTTEILRSMLYNGSDIIRDLEYVIFDEVHYINDAERGVVWEEVLILLPDHVNIIMLSATVPNTLVFADWVGRTKKKKIYVISTLKRPVPLEHYLYTGNNAKTKDERFLLQDATGRFLTDGYNKAVKAKKDRESKSKAATGAKGVRDRVGPQQEKNIWITLISHLESKDKLPVVAFTLSRNRCDQNAALLTSMDLTTSQEKSDIHHFISKCVMRLKGNDRRLPQVMQLTELLKRGIGIHHSGILPILKEVVEMLFQRGFVKLLFATETFAMGINMPARTVVFDNIRKHDGVNFRTLLPAEYIQMAGRAGRRGLDSTGTVIILCKNEVHELADLHGMMQGKPTSLESKFRLTYSMILNLLRVEQLRVEDMMKRSFSEISSQKKRTDHKERAKELRKKLETMPEVMGPLGEELATFYKTGSEYLETKSNNWTLLLSHPVALKTLSPGRVLIINRGTKVNILAVLLTVDKKSTTKIYSVLILGPDPMEEKKPFDPNYQAFLSLATYNRWSSNLSEDHHVQGHAVIEVKDSEIQEIATKSFKIDEAKIIADAKKREIPRFRDDPPGPSTSSAVLELKKFSEQVALDHEANLEVLNYVVDFKIQDMDLLQSLEKLQLQRTILITAPCAEFPDFAREFESVYERMRTQKELEDAEFLMSEASLTHLPDYHHRIEVLRLLRYIDNNNTVQLKGRVACEMGSHDLVMTELVLDNFLRDRSPAEIAALLSCMVFQQRNASAPELNASLEKGIAEIKKVAERVGQAQKDCGMEQPVQDYVEQFNFGLVEVVFEWARGMPFAEITQLTDVQEGVIVRTIQRLDETLRDVKDAARVIGEPVLYQKMDEASTIIKRDIVFAASLYTQ